MAKQPDQRLVQAMQALAAGNAINASLLCEAVLSEKRGDDFALALRAQALNALGHYDEAMQSICQAIAKNKKRADYHGLQADMLTTQGQFRKAIAAYDKALKINPSHHGVIAGKANTWLRLNEPKKALQLLKPLMKANNADVTLLIAYAKTLIAMDEPFEAAQCLIGRLPASSEPNETRRTLYFTLGKAMEQAGEYQSAFEAYVEGNTLSPSGFDVEDTKQKYKVIKSLYSADGIGELPTSEIDASNRVFIVGMLRSGSTLTEQIIDAHPMARGIGESEVLPSLINTELSEQSIEEWQNLTPVQLTEIATKYLDDTQDADEHKLVVDKQLGNYQFVGMIRQLFPNAKVIHCTRNPMSMGLSCFAQKLPPHSNPWASSLETIGQFYSTYASLMAHWSLCFNDLLEVPYESLVQNQEQWTQSILEYCGLPFDEQCLRFWESGRTVLTLSQDQVSKPMYTDVLKRHERFGSLLEPLQEQLP
ncbi:MAG: sulfotransferase [Planctomycetota bacterium]|nr:sulfotransferase [Planctomycetota bacterium]